MVHTSAGPREAVVKDTFWGDQQAHTKTQHTKTKSPPELYFPTPGLRPDMYPKALASGTYSHCVELEDGIAPKDKAQARKMPSLYLNILKPMMEWNGLSGSTPCVSALELKM